MHEWFNSEIENCQTIFRTYARTTFFQHSLHFFFVSEASFSPLIILGEMEQKPLISYPQIFLKFLLYFMIDKLWKKIVFS